MKKLLIVDGNSIANRAFYAMPFLSNYEGKPSGAVFGFANIILKLIQEEKPDNIVVAFDHARKTFRNAIYSEYKMQRKPTPDELINQFPVIKDMLDKMGIKVLECAGIEADDIIGTVSKVADYKKIILSGDRDLLQLIDKDTTVWLTKKGVTELDKVDEERLNEIFGIKPYQIIELKALMGDSSDNIPGVKGIGEKTALTLLEKYSTVENIYENIDNISGKLKEKLVNDKDMAYISKQLATIKRDCDVAFDINECELKFPFDKKLYDFFIEWNFTSLTKNNKLFVENIAEVTKKDTFKVLTKDVLDSLFLNNIKEFCYDLKEMKFKINDVVFYLEKNFDMFSNGLTIDEVCVKLKQVFEDKHILKITKNAKDDMHILAQYNIKLINYFDLSIADYVINPSAKSLADNLNLSDYVSTKDKLIENIKEKNLQFIFDEIERPLVDILFDMEMKGFKIDENKLEILSKEFEQKIDDIKKEIYIQADEEFNLNSPKQVAYILFEKLGIKAYNNKKQSTSAEKLDELRYIPIVDNILTYRKYSKIKNTYIDVYRKLCLSNGNIIHTTFNQTLTSTGRLSSSEPNLQNIPTRDDIGKVLRKIFVSKFDNGKIISADYNQIELRLMADMAGEENLIESYRLGEDIHRITASQIFRVPISEVTDNQRRDAKAVNFGIIYGISDFGLSQNIKSTVSQAKEYIKTYFDRYPKIKLYMDSNVSYAKENGYSKTKFGRIRNIPEIYSSNYLTRTFGERISMNMPLQGTASDIIKLAMIKVNEAFKKENIKSELVLQIHDELIVDTYPDEVEKVKEILKREMENAVTLKVPLIVSLGVGDSLYDCK